MRLSFDGLLECRVRLNSSKIVIRPHFVCMGLVEPLYVASLHADRATLCRGRHKSLVRSRFEQARTDFTKRTPSDDHEHFDDYTGNEMSGSDRGHSNDMSGRCSSVSRKECRLSSSVAWVTFYTYTRS